MVSLIMGSSILRIVGFRYWREGRRLLKYFSEMCCGTEEVLCVVSEKVVAKVSHYGISVCHLPCQKHDFLSAHLDNERSIILAYETRKMSNWSRDIPYEEEFELISLSAIVVQSFDSTRRNSHGDTSCGRSPGLGTDREKRINQLFCSRVYIIHSELGLTGSNLVSDPAAIHGWKPRWYNSTLGELNGREIQRDREKKTPSPVHVPLALLEHFNLIHVSDDLTDVRLLDAPSAFQAGH